MYALDLNVVALEKWPMRISGIAYIIISNTNKEIKIY